MSKKKGSGFVKHTGDIKTVSGFVKYIGDIQTVLDIKTVYGFVKLIGIQKMFPTTPNLSGYKEVFSSFVKHIGL